MSRNQGVVEIRSLDAEDRRTILDTFRRSGLHGEEWPRTVYTVLRVNLSSKQHYFQTRNSDESHAEKIILDFLWQKLRQRSLCSQEMTIYVNYSPCCKCCSSLIDFLRSAKKQNVRLKMEIIFSALYQIQRPSCLRSGHVPDWHRLPEENVHDKSLNGLHRLMNEGVELSTFRKQHWKSLAFILSLSRSFRYDSSRRREDETLEEDFKELLLDEEEEEGEEEEDTQLVPHPAETRNGQVRIRVADESDWVNRDRGWFSCQNCIIL